MAIHHAMAASLKTGGATLWNASSAVEMAVAIAAIASTRPVVTSAAGATSTGPARQTQRRANWEAVATV